MAETHTPPEEPAHDVLAAEAFAMPAPDPTIHHGPVRLPDDPTGIAEAHDVLAAEEFAMPAPRPHATPAVARAGGVTPRHVFGVVALLGVLLLMRRRRRR